MTLFLWIIFGLSAGVIANLFRSQEGSILQAMAIGAIGALCGGVLANMLFHYKMTTFSIGTSVVALFAAIIVIYLERVFLRKFR